MTDVVSKLKLKASVGQVGNDQIGGDVRFIYLGTVSTTNDYVYGNYSKTSGERVNEVANPNVGWEVSTKQNYGFELACSINLEIRVTGIMMYAIISLYAIIISRLMSV